MAKWYNNTQIVFAPCAAIAYKRMPITAVQLWVLFGVLFDWIAFGFERCHHIQSMDFWIVACPVYLSKAEKNILHLLRHWRRMKFNVFYRKLSNKLRLFNEKWSVPKNSTFNFELVELKRIQRLWWPNSDFNFLLYLNTDLQHCILSE